MARSPAWLRYNWRAVWLSLLYAAFLIAAVYGFKHALIPPALKYVVAVLPALPIIGIFVAMGRYLVEEQDEYLRMRMIRQILWTTGITLAATTMWGFMEDAGLPHLPMFYVAVLWFGGLGVTGCVIRLLDR